MHFGCLSLYIIFSYYKSSTASILFNTLSDEWVICCAKNLHCNHLPHPSIKSTPLKRAGRQPSNQLVPRDVVDIDGNDPWCVVGVSE